MEIDPVPYEENFEGSEGSDEGEDVGRGKVRDTWTDKAPLKVGRGQKFSIKSLGKY